MEIAVVVTLRDFPCHPPSLQWEFQDPKMELLYHIGPCFVGIFPYIGLIEGSLDVKLPTIWTDEK